MAYHNGKWESDRETRKRSEKMWSETKGPKGHGHKEPPGGHGAGGHAGHGGHGKGLRTSAPDDLTRAMDAEIDAMGPATTAHTTGGHTTGHTATGGGTLGSPSSWPGMGTRVDRPIIPGGCTHTGVTLSITLPSGKRLYGAQGHKITRAAHLDLIIDCAGVLGPRKAFVKSATAPRYRALNAATWPDVITLVWPDMTAPTQVGIKFWVRLLALLPADTGVCCIGGHGRTGTALAALLVADGVDADTAIKRVRTEHCPRAIETTEQENYIRTLARERGEGHRGDGTKGGRS